MASKPSVQITQITTSSGVIPVVIRGESSPEMHVLDTNNNDVGTWGEQALPDLLNTSSRADQFVNCIRGRNFFGTGGWYDIPALYEMERSSEIRKSREDPLIIESGFNYSFQSKIPESLLVDNCWILSHSHWNDELKTSLSNACVLTTIGIDCTGPDDAATIRVLAIDTLGIFFQFGNGYYAPDDDGQIDWDEFEKYFCLTIEKEPSGLEALDAAARTTVICECPSFDLLASYLIFNKLRPREFRKKNPWRFVEL